MPDNLPPPIQDLIARMLIVNPQERINIANIKQHPAFRIGLPENYVSPTPLPIPSIPNPIDPATIDPSVLSTLLQIGFADEQELIAEFSREGHSMAKVFYSMLTTNVSLESLPWVAPIIEQHPSEAYLQSPAFVGQNSLGFGSSPDFLPDSYSMGSEVSSLAERAPWAYLPTNDYKYDVMQPCLGIQLPLEQLMTSLQILLTSLHFQWFHPDDCSIFSRRADDMMYLVARCEKVQATQSITMNLYFSQASQNAIGNILENVKFMLSPSE
ncbi:putative CAMK family protein kinase [Tritrichomonas foetus]|uniref:CAMK family protein kinase n=1 Tax=Tritrichomonas foetus TaxID=1144522 RepID=A0A1J4JFC9_9EUKA|nr:putative CAMK family protein kinase [Tritrichomonas foetus]|eukprot:OHS96355.1 putative CAMK family protein kinase [Tritrichomonas foetus]